jgi:putative transposase
MSTTAPVGMALRAVRIKKTYTAQEMHSSESHPSDDAASANEWQGIVSETDSTECHPYRRLPQRKRLPHDAPFSLPDTEIWFVTICCRERGRNQLTREPMAAQLLGSAAFYHERGRWFIHLFLLMPDHLHALVSFDSRESLRGVVCAWKRYQATHHGIIWQRDFFDHRLRRDESFYEKAAYIRMNPVRAGLVDDPAKWPHVLMFDGRDGTQCRP